MTHRLTPRSHTERDEVAEALSAYVASADADTTLVALDTSLFASARAAYTRAREAHDGRVLELRAASEAAAAADADFDRELRLFAASVRDEAGRASPRVVSRMLGGALASELVKRPYREEVSRARTLLVHLSVRKDLDVDAARVEALRASTEALEVALMALEAAERGRLAAGMTLSKATTELDYAYSRLLRAARAMFPDSPALAVFPRFQRSGSSEAVEAGAPGADAAPVAG